MGVMSPARPATPSAPFPDRRCADICMTTNHQLARSLYFHSDVIALYVRREPGATAAALERRLRRAADRAYRQPGTSAVSRDESLALLRFHCDLVTSRGPMVHKLWSAACSTTLLQCSGRCPWCDNQLFGDAFHSRLYPGYARRVVWCPRDGLLVDEPAHWPPSTDPALTVTYGRVTLAVNRLFPSEARDGVAQLAWEFHQVAAELSDLPAIGPTPGGQSYACGYGGFFPGVYGLVLVTIHHGDYGYFRAPVVLPEGAK